MSLLFFGLIPIFSIKVFAYDGGMLNGVVGDQYGFAPGWILTDRYITEIRPGDPLGTKITEMTDNNLSTAFATGGGLITRYELARPANLISLKYNYDASHNLFEVSFYSKDNVWLGKQQLIGFNNQIDIDFSDVKYVDIHSSTNNGHKGTIYEFDVFGEYNIPNPTNLNAVPSVKKINLSWDYTPTADFVGYEIYMDDELIATTTNNLYTVNNLVPDELHKFNVRAIYKTYGTGRSQAKEAFAYSDLLTKPVLKALVDSDNVKLTWDALEGISYKLYSNNQLIMNAVANSFNHNYLTVETNYSYYLEIVDKYGRVVKSDTLTVKTREPPPIVKPLILASSIKHNSMQLNWQKLTMPYTVKVNGEIVSSTVFFNTYLLLGLDANTSYDVQVSFTDEYQRQVESDIYTFTTADLPNETIPKLTVSNVKIDSARLTWTNTGKSYEIYENDILVKTQTGIFISLTNLTEATIYSYKVIAIDDFNRRVESNIVTFTTLTKPVPTPTPLPTATPVPTERPIPTKAPPVSNSGNPSLDEANDELVQGAKDTKTSFLSMIFIIIAIFILVFGTYWLMRVYKKKMSKSASSKSRSSGSPGASTKANQSSRSSNRSSYSKSNYSRNNRSYNKNYNNEKRRSYVKKSSFQRKR